MKNLFLLLAIISFLLNPAHAEDTKAYMSQVKRVIDGDTLELENGAQVRLIGIDCPETEYSPAEASYLNQGKKRERSPEDVQHAQEAREFTKQLVEGKEVRLEFDAQQKDQSGRLLAYVFHDMGISPGSLVRIKHTAGTYWVSTATEQYSIFLNATIVGTGYASPMTIPPNVKYADLFQKLYQEARENKRGLWKEAKAIPTPICPKCGSKDVAKIFYGLPTYQLTGATERSDVVLGGCIVSDDSPRWACKTCKHRW